LIDLIDLIDLGLIRRQRHTFLAASLSVELYRCDHHAALALGYSIEIDSSGGKL